MVRVVLITYFSFKYMDNDIAVRSMGVRACIIDFTNSRLLKSWQFIEKNTYKFDL